MSENDLLKQWMPVVHTLSEAEAFIFAGKLRALSIPSTVFHKTIYTVIFGYSSLDEYVVIIPVRSYRSALMALNITETLTYDYEQTMGGRYDFWLIYNLSVPGLILSVIRNLRRHKRRKRAG